MSSMLNWPGREAIGHALREARERRQRSAPSVSTSVGMHVSCISRTENGLRDVSLIEAAALCEEYGIGVMSLIGRAARIEAGGLKPKIRGYCRMRT